MANLNTSHLVSKVLEEAALVARNLGVNINPSIVRKIGRAEANRKNLVHQCMRICKMENL
ncbi:MAG: hypothetical protein CM1200mP38_3770 [Dehalococcoidia bacterium]|nr:MAG: hypothetical protein CM1200mP38_3770 [Dehalococcoidia bacterium]